MAPLKIEVSGASTIYRPAERAVLSISVLSEGDSQEEVSKNVAASSKRIKDLLEPLASKDSQGQAAEHAPVTHWSNSSLSTGSYFRYNNNGKKRTRVYTASTSFEAKFKDFAKLGSTATSLSTMEHVSINNISWRLTEKTKTSLSTKCRQDAVRDAIAKATDYAAALDKPAPPVTQIHDSNSGMPVTYSGVSRMRSAMVQHVEADDQPILNFEPENVSLESSVVVTFESA